LVDGDDGRLVEDDAFALDVHQGIGSPQVDSHVVGEKARDRVE
jgi:hypothetical protein